MSKLAVAYLRVSTATNQDGHGFDRQKQAIDEFADLGRFQLQKIFHEVWTGAEAERPALSEMLVFLSTCEVLCCGTLLTPGNVFFCCITNQECGFQ
ncbi:MAG: recombinase family protein [Verrucomicrobia bacterium]|nr:recombinase family protein [Verrucomicrobiota bacterium]MBT5477935.1 recombinase family protein [Verrucomicrobiota bacterium]MBT6238406.1 recombinase family protein [Verrucomicrobiota bacterium]MBT6805666.1 recombinase family protein [Verrucomicrobiota bacterium]MBT7537251.1 recombinase family protein [Verrucomicrobiota bacterium]